MAEKYGWYFNPPYAQVDGSGWVKFYSSGGTANSGDLNKVISDVFLNYKKIRLQYRFKFTTFFNPLDAVVYFEFRTMGLYRLIFYKQHFEETRWVKVEYFDVDGTTKNIWYGGTPDFLEENKIYEVYYELDVSGDNHKIRVYTPDLFDTGELLIKNIKDIDFGVWFYAFHARSTIDLFVMLDYIKAEGLKR